MNRYILIRSDNKSISEPMEKNEALNKVKEYDSQGISVYLISETEGFRIKNETDYNQ